MELTLDQAFEKAVVAHNEGKLQDAERFYRAILQAQPKHPDANHNLGLLAVAVGKPREALPLFKLALGANPKIEQFWLSYIDALIKVGGVDEAKRVLVEGKKSGVSSDQFDALNQRLQGSGPNDTKKILKNQALTEKRKVHGGPSTAEPSKDQINQLLGHYQAGRLEEAELLATLLTQQFPSHPFGWKVLGVVFQQTDRLRGSLTPLQSAVELSSQDAQAHYNLGVTLQELGSLDGAEASYTQAIALRPDYAEAHSNLGNTFQELSRLNEAEASYRQAIALKPDYPEAHFNLGNTLQELGSLDEAEASYRRAVTLSPDFVEAHCNWGVSLQKRGRLGEAAARYEQALALQPDFANAQANLVNLLTRYTYQEKSSQLIVKVDQEIKEIKLNENTAGVISNDEIIHLFYKFSNIIKKHGLDLGTELSQTYRRNSVELNCERHKKIFDTFNVIPKFCFGCYKVQVEPRSVLELIKLFVVFDQIKLTENNTRKCMIEMRAEIPGFYKGLIYCSSLKEAYQIADYLESVIEKKIGSGLPLAVKRGCSEYSIAHPDFMEINKSGTQLMNYPADWEPIEGDFDSKNSINIKSIRPPSLSCFSLSDVLVIRNWIDYAKGIGDSSAQLLKQNRVGTKRVYEIAKSRLETHLKKKPSS
jgi:tetratricopeptide (TPR) repeat protein